MQDQLQLLWAPRWLQDSAPSVSDWERITNFARHYLPTGTFSVTSITVNQWRRSIKRFRQRAARGCDGFDRGDLLAMSDSQVSTLLSLLHAVEENDDTGWPVQLLEGFVLSLAKVEAPHLAVHYRPIVLLSIIYRCWASLRSRQLLRWLAQLVPEDAYGFIPGREPAQVWLLLQAQIEATIESQHSLCGLSSDIVRAFNNIRRVPLFELAAHLGVPSRLTSPWKKFLSTFRRRFSVHGQLSDAYTSNTGFPEGCPLSVAAMAVLNWSMHAYLARFNPEARLRSFVDNLTITATAARQVAPDIPAPLGATARRAKDLDLGNYRCHYWREVGVLRFPVLPDACELGGTVCYGLQKRNRLFLQRWAGLEPCWRRLWRSRAPLARKLHALPAVFWAKALHGAGGAVFSDRHLQKLRTQATRALHIQHGGSNPLLRLSLSRPATADPGYYQLRRSVFDFRRIALKSPELLDHWSAFCNTRHRANTTGPFSKMQQLFELVGWSVLLPPVVQDHDGVGHNLLGLDPTALEHLLHDAWAQFVARQV